MNAQGGWALGKQQLIQWRRSLQATGKQLLGFGTNLAHLDCKSLQNTDKRCNALLTPKLLIKKKKIR